MTTADVVISTRGTGVRIEVSGEIDLENATSVEAQLAAAIPNDATDVHLGMAGLEYLDSAGLRVLFALAARLEVLQIGLRCHVPKGSVPRRVLELSGFEQLAPLDDRPGD